MRQLLTKMRHPIYILFLLVAVLTSCHQTKGTYIDERDKDYQLYDYYVDSYGNEGIVAGIYTYEKTNEKSIIVLSLDEAYLPWGPMGEKVYPDSISHYGLRDAYFGIAMLQIMKSIGISRYPSQEWCDLKNKDEAYVRGGSWHLPTFAELYLIFGDDGEAIPQLNQALSKHGGVPITKQHMYWTCVEDFDGYLELEDEISNFDQANRAIAVRSDIKFYTNKDYWLKKNRYNVRAVKYIYYQYDGYY